jgi:FkbM family methyltransferase
MIDTPTMDVDVRDITIRFAVANGRLRVWAERFAEIEPELLDLIDEMPEGLHLYDAGASIGLFSLYAAIKRGAHIVAIEPEAQNFATMELNHFLNRASLKYPMHAINVALGDELGLGSIFTRVYGAGEHVKILDSSETRDTRESFNPEHIQSVLKMPLDYLIASFGLPEPNMLKIDVDGSELALLRGASRTLDSPSLHTVFIELYEETSDDERAILEANGFTLQRKSPVVRLRGGYYDGLYNCVYRR